MFVYNQKNILKKIADFTRSCFQLAFDHNQISDSSDKINVDF